MAAVTEFSDCSLLLHRNTIDLFNGGIVSGKLAELIY